MRPRLSVALLPPAPTNAITLSTFGLRRRISAAWRCLSIIASKPMSCAAWVNTNSWPVSSFGRKPFGTRAASTPVATTRAKNVSSTMKRWRTIARKVRPYSDCVASNARSQAW